MPLIDMQYCPRCDRYIPDGSLQSIRKELSERFGNEDLDRGLCPACGTRMVSLPDER